FVDRQALGGQVPLGVGTRQDDGAVALRELHNGGQLQVASRRVARRTDLQIVVVDQQDNPAWTVNHFLTQRAVGRRPPITFGQIVAPEGSSSSCNQSGATKRIGGTSSALNEIPNGSTR